MQASPPSTVVQKRPARLYSNIRVKALLTAVGVVLVAVVFPRLPGYAPLGAGIFRSHQQEYPPHERASLPWFEGWYTRVQTANWSLGFGIGHLPNQSAPHPVAACFLLLSSTKASTADRPSLQSFTQYFEHMNLTTGRCQQCGASVKGSTRDFVLQGSNATADWWCEMRYEGQQLGLHGSFNGLEVHLTMDEPGAFTPWAPHHQTEGWLPSFATKLHWYVQSLSSPVHASLSSGAALGGVATPLEAHGIAHLEKNWGNSFPPRWLWAQGQNFNKQGNSSEVKAAFVLAGGSLPTRVLSVPMFAFSYFSPDFNASIDPWNPPLWFKTKTNGCNGTLAITLYTLQYTVEVTSKAPFATFSPVVCPTTKGFIDYAVESYVAVTDVKIYRWDVSSLLKLKPSRSLLAHSTFHGAALEFGGEYRCT